MQEGYRWRGGTGGEFVRRPLAGLLDRSVPDFDESSDGRRQGREVPSVDASLRQAGCKRLQQNLPLVDGPRLGRHGDLHRADGRLLDLDRASYDTNVAQMLTVCTANFPCAVSA